MVQASDIGFGVWFTEIFVILGTAWVMLRATGRSPAGFTRLSAVRPGPMVFGFLLGVTNYVAVVIPLQFLTTSLAPKSWLIDESRIFEQASSLELAAVITGVGLIAPLCEEFLFRGMFQRALHVGLGRPIRAVVVAALVFSAFHFDAVGFLPRFELGVLFGVLFLRYDSLWPGVCAHAANNLVPTALYFAAGGAATATDAMPKVRDVLSLATVGLGALLVLLLVARYVRAWAPRPGLHEGEERVHPPLSIAHAALPWAWAALVTLLAFYGTRAYVEKKAAEQETTPAPHIIKL
jgi:membrane protease YdiL (CAAX protease family)